MSDAVCNQRLSTSTNGTFHYLRASAQNAGHDFCREVANRLDDIEFDILGLGTICSSYPLTIRIAHEVKSRKPKSIIIVGGPQASVTDVPTLEAFGAIDYVVRGEAEETFPRLLDGLNGEGPIDKIAGITYRNMGAVVRRPNAPVIENLDALPFPAFHLFPNVEQCKYLPLELGRGCPFACRFCSTNDFFRRKFRLKSPATMLSQMRAVQAQYGIQTFELIHDMFTVDRKRVSAFCEELLGSGEHFYWSCSARTDCIDEDLIDLMHRAGCRGIFFGIESGSPRMQKIINKRLDLDEARRMIDASNRFGIRTAVSLISGFPEEQPEDLHDTIEFYADSLRFEYANTSTPPSRSISRDAIVHGVSRPINT